MRHLYYIDVNIVHYYIIYESYRYNYHTYLYER